MSVVMQVVGYARDIPCPFAGQYLEWYDPNAPAGNVGVARFTNDISKAKRFEDAGEAMREWSRVREIDPIRPDGKPNRPLTAFTVTIERVTT